jgi:hypothetical protein
MKTFLGRAGFSAIFDNISREVKMLDGGRH